MPVEQPRLRIGQLAKRVGASPELLRAWESRYDLVHPERTGGGLRLYSHDDEQRIRRMQAHIAEGYAPAEAARLAKGASAVPPSASNDMVAALAAALDAFDESAAQTALDRIFETLPLDVALSGVILPYLNELGGRWAAADTSVVAEHFASNVIEGRLRALARGWDDGVGPRALLACPPGEQHELGLLCFGLALRGRGWRIVYLGASTPITQLATRSGDAAVIVLAAVSGERFDAVAEQIATLAGSRRVALGGAGATSAIAVRAGAELLDADIATAAAALAP